MSTRAVSLRIPEETRLAIEEIAQRSGRGFTSVANEMLDEAVRTRRVRGIVFADEFERREAKVGGTGLGVWEIIETYQDVGADWERFKSYYTWLNDFQLRAALAYWRAYPDEIDAKIADNASWTPERLYSTYPWMKPPEPHQLRSQSNTED